MAEARTTNLLLIQPQAFEYRRALYEGLADRLSEHDVSMRIVVGHEQGDRLDSYAASDISVSGDRLSTWTGDRLRYRPWRAAVGRGFKPDLVIVEQAIKNLETYPALAGQWLRGPRVAMWGHGRSYSTAQSPPLARWKQYLTRRSDWFFAYTDKGADHVVSCGFPPTRLTVLHNTLDTRELVSATDSFTEQELSEFSESLGLTPGRTALFIGGVDSRKDIGTLLEAADLVAEELPGFVLLVVGSGRDVEMVQRAQQQGRPVRALGRLDGKDKAKVMAVSDILTIPSWIGLVAVDSLAAGLPIVTRTGRAHSPEAEYLEPGIDSLWLPYSAGAEEYAHGVAGILRDDELRGKMRRACLVKAGGFGIEGMVDRFAAGILAWRDSAPRRV